MTPDEELFWLAFRHALGELSPRDEAAFVERLAHEQPAREALARAVELTAALRSIGSTERRAAPLELAQPISLWRQRLGWMAAGLAVALAGVMAVQTLWLDRGNPAVAQHDVEDASAGLALAWIHTSDQLPTDLELNRVDELADAGDVWTLGFEPSDAIEPDDGVAPPSWLLAAVAVADEPDMNVQEN